MRDSGVNYRYSIPTSQIQSETYSEISSWLVVCWRGIKIFHCSSLVFITR
jgi:hypothetical protein